MVVLLTSTRSRLVSGPSSVAPPEPTSTFSGPIPASLRRLWRMEEPAQPAAEPGVLAVRPVTIVAGGDAPWTAGVRLRLKARAGDGDYEKDLGLC